MSLKPETLEFAADLEARGTPVLRKMLDEDPQTFARIFEHFVDSPSAILLGELTDEDLANALSRFVATIRARVKRYLH